MIGEHETSWIYPVPCLDNERLHRSEVPTECEVHLIVSSVGATWASRYLVTTTARRSLQWGTNRSCPAGLRGERSFEQACRDAPATANPGCAGERTKTTT